MLLSLQDRICFFFNSLFIFNELLREIITASIFILIRDWRYIIFNRGRTDIKAYDIIKMFLNLQSLFLHQ